MRQNKHQAQTRHKSVPVNRTKKKSTPEICPQRGFGWSRYAESNCRPSDYESEDTVSANGVKPRKRSKLGIYVDQISNAIGKIARFRQTPGTNQAQILVRFDFYKKAGFGCHMLAGGES